MSLPARTHYDLILIFLTYLGGRSSCGGTIITPTVILSAAHCTFGFAPSQIDMGLGCSVLSQCDRVIRGVQQVRSYKPLHQQFKPKLKLYMGFILN